MVTVLIPIGGSIVTLSVPQFNASFLCSEASSEVTLVMKRYCMGIGKGGAKAPLVFSKLLGRVGPYNK